MTNKIKTSASGFKMPSIGLGTWGMGGRSTAHDPDNDDARDIKAIRYALESGMTHIDTAEIYAGGYAETLVARALKDVPRDTYSVATKVPGVHQSETDIVKSCRASLERLQLEYADLYYLHWPNHEIPLKETAQGLIHLRQEGLIRHYGVCNFAPETMKRLQDHLDQPIAVNQSHYSLPFREPEAAGLIEHCAEVGTLFAAWRPILWHYEGRTGQPGANPWVTGAFPMLEQVAEQLGKTSVQIAINWLISQPNIVTLVKSSTPKNIDEIMGSLGWDMPPELIEELRRDFPEQFSVSNSVPLS